MRSKLLSEKVKDLHLNEHAPMPRELKLHEQVKKETFTAIRSWRLSQRMHLVKGGRNE